MDDFLLSHEPEGAAKARRQAMHVDSGLRCLVLHHDQDGQCTWCPQCNQWIKPSQMNSLCLSPERENDQRTDEKTKILDNQKGAS